MMQLTPQMLENAALDCQTIADVATSTEEVVVDRLGRSKRTLMGAILAIGYEPPVAYASGLLMEFVNQTVEQSGGIYAPKPSELPFTTSGTFEASKFRLIDASTAIVPDNAVSTEKVQDGAITAEKLADTLDLSGKTLAVANQAANANDSAPANTAMVQAAISARTASEAAPGIIRLGTAAGYNDGTDPDLVLTLKVARDNNVMRASLVATTSGKSVTLTSIPSWAKRIEIVLDAVSTNGNDYMLLQLGDSGGIENTGYASTISWGAVVANATNGFLVTGNSAGTTSEFSGTITLHNTTGNTWVCSGVTGSNGANLQVLFNGRKTLSAKLDRIRLTTFNGSNDFDGGGFVPFFQ